MSNISTKIAILITSIFGAGSGKVISILIISMIPILELRGGITVAKFVLHANFQTAMIVSIVGNLLPIPFILIFLEKLFNFMKKHHIFDKAVLNLEDRALKSKSKIEKYEFWGLVLFVGIPLPGTGAWTGALVASVLKMDKKQSMLAIALGVILAAIIVTILTYGLLGTIFQ